MQIFQNHRIILGQGLDNIMLGMTRDEVLAQLGDPDEIEEHDYDDGDLAYTFYYDAHGFDLTFESDDDFKLSFISVYGEQFHLEGQIRIGQNKQEVNEAITMLKLSKPNIQDMSSDDAPEQELVAFDKENLNLWFISDVLDEIQIGPFWLDDDTPIWPKSKE